MLRTTDLERSLGKGELAEEVFIFLPASKTEGNQV
jgi:hypothetical protein